MRGESLILSLATATSLLSSAVESLELVKKSSPAVVGFEIARNHVTNPVTRDRMRWKRDTKTVEQELDNELMLYYCNITLGTPPQKIRTHIDTGSSDLWVNVPDSRNCDRRSQPCDEAGTFDPKKSSTNKFVSDDFNISYVDGSGASGDYVTDKLGIGGVTLDKFQFALGEVSSSTEGVLGIGYAAGEVQALRTGDKPYPNLPQALVDANYIQSNAYSLWLNDLDASKGEILFGGINTGKFKGDLQTIPVIPNRYDEYTSLIVNMTGIAMKRESGTVQNFTMRPIAVALDSGTSLSYISDHIVEEIYDRIGALYDSVAGIPLIPCKMNESSEEFIFSFMEPEIVVKMDELVIDMDITGPGLEKLFDGDSVCAFGLVPSGGDIDILGDTVLRSAYVVYDLENNEISLAQTVFNSGSDNIIEIKSGKDGLPTASGDPTASITASPSATGTRVEPDTTETSEAAAAPTMRPDLSLGLAAGLAGAGVVFAAM